MNEKEINKKYNIILDEIEELIGHNQTTYSTELDRIGSSLLGKTFTGVYASDKIKLKEGHCCISNLDASYEPGSHWIAIYEKNNIKHVYDSFGRKTNKIIKLKGKVKDADGDAEQKKSEENCGQRCIAWLVYIKKYGLNEAMRI